MKKLLPLIALFLIMSCSSDEASTPIDQIDQTGAKLKKITTDNYTAEFFYTNNKLSYTLRTEDQQVFKTELIYENNEVVKLKRYINNVYQSNSDYFYVYSNEKIITSSGYEDGILFSKQYTYNSSGQLSEVAQYDDGAYCCTSYYKYDSLGNIKSVSSQNNYNGADNLYDNKINPEYYIYNSSLAAIFDVSKNNKIKSSAGTYEYEYNAQNMPTKRTYIIPEFSTEVQYYEYY